METQSNMTIGTTVQLLVDFDTALAKVVAALKTEGFGVLTEIDVKDTLKKKLDVDFRPYRILGACNPPLAYRSISAVPEVGLLLPCNVIVYQASENVVEVSLVDPLVMLGVLQNPELQEVAQEAGARLKRVAQALSSGS
mgnify:FL=1